MPKKTFVLMYNANIQRKSCLYIKSAGQSIPKAQSPPMLYNERMAIPHEHPQCAKKHTRSTP